MQSIYDHDEEGTGNRRDREDTGLETLRQQQRNDAGRAIDQLNKTGRVSRFSHLVILFNMYFQRREHDMPSYSVVAHSPERLIFLAQFAYKDMVEWCHDVAPDERSKLLDDLNKLIMEHSGAEAVVVDQKIRQVEAFWGLVADLVTALKRETMAIDEIGTRFHPDLVKQAYALVLEASMSQEEAFERVRKKMERADNSDADDDKANEDNNICDADIGNSNTGGSVDMVKFQENLLALSKCPRSPPSVQKMYGLAYRRCSTLINCHYLKAFVARFRYREEPPIQPFQKESAEALLPKLACRRGFLASAQVINSHSKGAHEAASFQSGIHIDQTLSEKEIMDVMEKDGETLGHDEQLHMGEIHDYYIKKLGTGVQQEGYGTRGQRRQHNRPRYIVQETSRLIKPYHFCKATTGYVWNAYNRAKYNSRDNPPPKEILSYEFVIYYPLIVRTKESLNDIYRVEYTENGKNDDYVIIIFSPGPPYADVAYRIINKPWDSRRGGVQGSFDDKGKFRLYFRFESTNYRR